MEGESLKTIVGKSGHASDLLVFKDDDFLMSEQQYQKKKNFCGFPYQGRSDWNEKRCEL